MGEELQPPPALSWAWVLHLPPNTPTAPSASTCLGMQGVCSVTCSTHQCRNTPHVQLAETVNGDSEHSEFGAQVWIRTGAKGSRLLQQLLMQTGEPEAKVVGTLLIQEGRAAAHVRPGLLSMCSSCTQTPDAAGKPCGLLSRAGSAEIQSHPLCVHRTLTLQSPRAPHSAVP